MSRASEWFITDAEFRQVCGDAQSMARGEKAEEFAAKMVKAANQYGIQAFLSKPQMKWLCQLADIVEPVQRSTHAKA